MKYILNNIYCYIMYKLLKTVKPYLTIVQVAAFMQLPKFTYRFTVLNTRQKKKIIIIQVL